MKRFVAERRLQSLRTLERKCPLRIKPFHSSERFRTSGERAQVLAAKCAGYHFFLGILLGCDFLNMAELLLRWLLRGKSLHRAW